jgi:hypothetical protein
VTFTYAPLVTDRDKVRFHIGDTDESAPIFSDEEIVAIISMAGGWQEATIACLRHVIARLAASPSFTADWLKVDTASAISAYTRLLNSLLEEFDLNTESGLEVGVTYVYRADSDADEEPYRD